MDDIVLGAKQIANPKGIKPQLDTDRPDVKKNEYVRMGTTPYYKGDSGMDTSNPPRSDINPPEKKHPIDELFGRGIKRSNGRSIPKADVTISDN